MNRREFLRGLVVSSILIGIGVVGLDEMYKMAQHPPLPQQQSNNSSLLTISQNSSTSATAAVSNSTTTQLQSSTASTPPGYVFITQLSALNGLSYAYFMHPTYGSSIFVNYNGQWKAFSSTCTHANCNVQYQSSTIYCPCHGGTFSPSNGSVTGGPPPSPLPEFGVQIVGGNVYVSSTRIN